MEDRVEGRNRGGRRKSPSRSLWFTKREDVCTVREIRGSKETYKTQGTDLTGGNVHGQVEGFRAGPKVKGTIRQGSLVPFGRTEESVETRVGGTSSHPPTGRDRCLRPEGPPDRPGE